MRTPVGLAAVASLLVLWGSASAQTMLLDAVLASVESEIITASDIALARGLDLLGFHPVEARILPADVERLVDVRLVEREALRLGVQPSADAVEEAWRSVAARAGGEAALRGWLVRTGIDVAAARDMVEADLRRREFIDLRFRPFAFVSEAEVEAALGDGPHTVEERRRAHQALQDAAVDRSLAAWLQEARARAAIRRLDIGPEGVPTPFPMPPGASRGGAGPYAPGG